MYFKIYALCFEINALYFLQEYIFVFQQLIEVVRFDVKFWFLEVYAKTHSLCLCSEQIWRK